MKFTKILALLLAAVMLVSIVACGKDDNKPATTTAAQGGEGTQPQGGDDNPAVTPETPATGDALTTLLAKALPQNTKVGNLKNKGYEVAEGSEVEYLFDSDLTTGLKATLAEGNTLTFKLTLKTTLVAYAVYSGATAPTAWTLQASSDGSTWVDLDVVGQSNAVANAGAGYEIDADKVAQYAYYKFVFTDSAIDINEICLVGTNEEEPVTDPQDIADGFYLDGSDVAGLIDTVTLDGITFDGDAKAAIFADPEVPFKATASEGATITVKYAYPTGVNSYVITAKNANLVSYSIYGSQDGTTWVPLDVVCDAKLTAGVNGYDMDKRGQQNYLKIVINKTAGEIELDKFELIGFSTVGPTVDGGTWSTYVNEQGRTVYVLEKARAYNHSSFNLYKLGWVEGAFSITLGGTYSVPWPNGGGQGSFGIYACGQDHGGDGSIDENGDDYYLCYSTGLIEKNEGSWGGWNVNGTEWGKPEDPSATVVFTLDYDGEGNFKYYVDGELVGEYTDAVSDPFTEGYVCIACKQSTEDGPLEYELYEFTTGASSFHD